MAADETAIPAAVARYVHATAGRRCLKIQPPRAATTAAAPANANALRPMTRAFTSSSPLGTTSLGSGTLSRRKMSR